MESEILVVMTMFGVLLAVLALLFVRGDGETNRKLARVRVRVDDTRRGQPAPEPPEEEFEPGVTLLWMVIGSLLFFIVVLLANLSS